MTIDWHDARAHGFRHDPLKAIVAPRPIGWISTYAADGTANLAPYSFFNLVSDRPKIVMFASNGFKHSATNAIARGGFAANLATSGDRAVVSESSAELPAGESEFEASGLTPLRCRMVDAPRIEGNAAVLECAVTEHMIPRTREGGRSGSVIVFGEIVGYWLDDALLRDGRFDSAAARLLSRLGYRDYAVVDETFEMVRPTDAAKSGEGRTRAP